MGECRSALSTRASTAELVAYDGVALKSSPLLQAEAHEASWRLIELFSAPGMPFDADLAWSAGSGAGASAKLTVASAARVCVFARSLEVRATNLTNQKNRVALTISDGMAFTRNQWEHRCALSPAAPQVVAIPPFAERFEVAFADPTVAPNVQIRVFSGTGQVMAGFVASQQPPTGVPIGGAARVELASTVKHTARVLFHLAL